MKPDPLPPVSSVTEGDSGQTTPLPPIETSTPAPTAVAAPSAPRRSIWRTLGSLFTFVVLLALLLLVWLKHNDIIDWVVIRNFHPSAAIESISSQTSMTAYGKRLFYVNHPEIEGKTVFNQHCSDASAEVAVLGCYRGDRRGIYLYNVTDSRLSGIQQVTAAHETLHQAYDRLTSKERQHIDELLQAYAATITDKDLLDKIDIYRKTEPGQLETEMHSIFGTEVAQLPPELENYYKQYFSDRQKIVAMHAQYKAAFSERNKQIAAYDEQLAVLKPQIESLKQDLSNREATLSAQRAQMNTLLANHETEAYNAMVAPFNAEVSAYKKEVATVNALIQQYNATIDARNKIAIEEQDLLRAQDSHADTATQQ